eukprot:SAG11_NODE_151_length_14583_cov_21.306200_14_plen_77_part_00
MDELGRGTSTFDGVAIAYAVAKTLANQLQSRSVFSTHYHTLMGDFNSDPQMSVCHMGCLAGACTPQNPAPTRPYAA